MLILNNFSGFGVGSAAGGAVADGIGRIPTMTSGTTSGVTMSASSEFGAGNEAWRAGNTTLHTGSDNGSSMWLSAISTNGNLNVDLGSARTIFTYDVANSAYQSGCTTGWNFQGANASDYSDAVTLDTRTSISFASGLGDTKTYTIASPSSYRYYRWVTTQRGGGGGGYSGFIEVQLYS